MCVSIANSLNKLVFVLFKNQVLHKLNNIAIVQTMDRDSLATEGHSNTYKFNILVKTELIFSALVTKLFK